MIRAASRAASAIAALVAHLLREGAHRQCIPGLRGIVHAVGVIGMRVVEPCIGILDVPGRQDQQTRMLARRFRIGRE